MDLAAVARLGGKGAQTIRMVDLGLPVPRAAVVPVEAYRRFVQEPGVAALLARVRVGEVVEADAVDACFLATAVPAELVADIRRIGADVAGGGRLAVRSSATVEDLGGTSFAGQYRSFTDVAIEDVVRSVVLVWASLWHPAPCAYRRVHGIDEDGAAMAVLLMAMVDATKAGVVFTVDPVEGSGRVRVEAVDGLGEALVSGAVTPECWSLPRDEAAAAPPPVGEAAALALQVEQAFGVPVDVEWAWDGTRVWLVQARPITVAASGDGFDTEVDDHRLTTAGIAEMLPGVLPPLIWQLAGTAVEEALRGSFDAIAATDAGLVEPHALVRRVRGNAAVDLDGLEAVAARLPGAAVGAVEHGFFGGDEPAAAGGRASLWRSARHDLRVDAARRLAQRDAEVVVAALEVLGKAEPTDLSALDDQQLHRRRRQLVDLGFRAMAAELGVAAAATAGCDRLRAFVAGHLDDAETARRVRGAITGVGGATNPPWASMSVFAGPTWTEASIDPVAIAGDADAGEEARRQLEARLQSLPRWRSTRILTGQVVDVRIHVLRRLVGDARSLLGWRERTKAAVLAIGGLVRAANLEAGSRMAARGDLGSPLDVDLLSDAELRGADPLPPPAELGRRRRALERMVAAGPLPERFVGVPAAELAPLPDGDRLEGIGASGGRATARARVVRDPRHARFRAGEVLVATATDAGWSPLFVDAAAIVVERGGPLSHAAIVARELGIPAVLDVHGATQRLDGRIVTVDGDAGAVAVHPAREPT